MRNAAMVFVAISGCIAIVLGAFGAHYLNGKVDTGVLSLKNMHAYETAVHYQLFHTLALMAVFILKDKFPLYNRITGILFASGIVLFSGSIYLLSTSELSGIDFHWLGPVTPLGGLCFMAAWGILLVSVLKTKQEYKQ